MTQNVIKAAFFDRDGCIIVNKHYLDTPSGIEYYSDTMSALKKLIDNEFELFVVTNQSGIGRGYFTEDQMHSIHKKMDEDFAKYDIKINEYIFCPHTPDDNCTCRKPKPGMLETLIEKYNISRAQSFMVGDKESDAKCGAAAHVAGHVLYDENPHFKSFKSLTELADHYCN